MIGHSRGQALAAYQSVATHGGVAAADAHGLILMLLDGLLERLATIRGAIEHGDYAQKGQVVNRAFAILQELRGSLDFDAGGALARNLDSLYDYCYRLLLKASIELRTAPLDEAGKILQEIRSAWLAVAREGRAR
jgi:flagellar protein FliS